MAIAINGSGTITGISAGGLPDNIITNAEMADDAIGIADLSATGTASSSTFLRGDNSWAAAGGGKLLQVVQTVKSDTTSQALTGGDGSNGQSTWTDISGMTASITPSASTLSLIHI